ncbi:MAG: hypothetical protein HY959_03475 [Ignavibacteriae bacterium]|nr:hypothetical protein [Ignavibacteriota bacterium]
MKTKKFIYVLSVILFVLIGFRFIPSNIGKNNSSSPHSSPTDHPNEFLIGAYDMKWDQLFYLHKDALKFNIWHNYEWVDKTTYNGVERYYPFGWGVFNSTCASDLLYNNIIDYQNPVKQVIKDNKNNGFWSLIQRPKIMWICYGQSSKYQCENQLSQDNFESFYAFNYHSGGEDIIDEGVNVRKFTCIPSENLEGTVISGVKVKNE